jgi:hypothetical protein
MFLLTSALYAVAILVILLFAQEIFVKGEIKAMEV